MAVTAFFFGLAIKNQWGGVATDVGDYGGTPDDWRTSLHSAYSPDVDTHDHWDSASGTEIAGTGYTAQGHDHGTSTLTYDAGTNETRFDAEDAEWTTASFSTTQGVHYNWQTAVAATAHMLSYVDFDGTQTVASGTFRIEWHANGICKITS